MNKKNLNRLYWEINGGNNDDELYLFGGEGEEPTYGSDSLFDKYGDCETNDIKVIFEEAPKDLKPYVLSFIINYQKIKYIRIIHKK